MQRRYYALAIRLESSGEPPHRSRATTTDEKCTAIWVAKRNSSSSLSRIIPVSLLDRIHHLILSNRYHLVGLIRIFGYFICLANSFDTPRLFFVIQRVELVISERPFVAS